VAVGDVTDQRTARRRDPPTGRAPPRHPGGRV